MKRTNHVCLRLTFILAASAAYAQAGGLMASADPSESSEVAAARSRYTQTDEVSQQENIDETLAQLSRRGRGAPFPPRRGNPNQRRPQPRWMDHGNASHAAIGAAIGFGLGALAGAKFNTDQHSGATAGAVVIFGGVGALIGGLIGGSHGGMYPFVASQASLSAIMARG